MHIEAFCLKEGVTLIKRDRRFISHIAGLYLLSFKTSGNIETGRLARASYFFFRDLDDRVDGVREHDGSPLHYALNIRHQIESGRFSSTPEIVELAKYSIPVLERRARQDDNPRQDFIAVIDANLFDYERRHERRVLSTEEIQQYYQATFPPLLNILFVGLGSALRARDVPNMANCQGAVYTVRDLEEDWNLGIINIPNEVLQEAQLTSSRGIDEVRTNHIVGRWLRDGLDRVRPQLLSLQEQFGRLDEPATSFLCNGLVRSMLKFTDQYLADRK